jgi:hypothetical protein
MLHDLLGILVVNGAIMLLGIPLSRRGLLDQRDRLASVGFYLVLAPVGLLAWFHGDLTLAVTLIFTLTGAVLLLWKRKRPVGPT